MDATERDPPGRARRNLVNRSMDVLGMQLEGVGDAHGADPISFAPRTFFDSSCDLRTARAHCQEITSLELVKLFGVPFSVEEKPGAAAPPPSRPFLPNDQTITPR